MHDLSLFLSYLSKKLSEFFNFIAQIQSAQPCLALEKNKAIRLIILAKLILRETQPASCLRLNQLGPPLVLEHLYNHKVMNITTCHTYCILHANFTTNCKSLSATTITCYHGKVSWFLMVTILLPTILHRCCQ